MKFTYNPRILRHLGYELITSDEIAITELVKNSYDAKAENVFIQFLSSLDNFETDKSKATIPSVITEKIQNLNPNGIVVIEDDGKGMAYEILRDGFFEVGSTLKKVEKNDSEDDPDEDNLILGDKGIGRLAAQRIAPILIVESLADGDQTINIIEVDWEEFIINSEFDAPEWQEECLTCKSYTRLWLVGNDKIPVDIHRYSEVKNEYDTDLFGNVGKSLGQKLVVKSELQTALGFLYSPFEEKKSVINIDISVDGIPVKLDFNYQALGVAESVHSFKSTTIFNEEGKLVDLKFELKLEIRPWFIERIHHRELGNVLYQDWKRSPSEYQKLFKKYESEYKLNLSESFLLSEALKKWKKKDADSVKDGFLDALLKLSPLEGKIYSFKRDNTLMSIARRSAVENGYIDASTRINYDIRPFLDANNGIKLYRNSFRIATIGNRDNDWLELQQKRTSGQQFYRFELGNVVGFIKINDKKQEYIYETSSREHLTQNIYAESLRITLNEILEIFSPNFSKLAVELTKRFLTLEPGWIPENNEEEIQNEVDKAKEVFETARKNLAAIKEAITAIKDNIDLDSEDKIASVKRVFEKLEPVALNFEQNIDDTTRSLKSANQLLEVAKQEQVRIKTEAYNNYKLMANGLVTEIITHELHSLLSSSEEEERKYDEHFSFLESYFLENELYDINKLHFLPVKKKFEHLFKKMGDLDKFYSFLDKTFIKNEGNRALLPTDVKSELEIIIERFKFRLKRHKVDVDISGVTNIWEVPKGALLHVFYNLIDNSIYWIRQRQKISKTNIKYERSKLDSIIIKTTSPNTLQFHDTGIGVLDRYQHILFNELVSGKEDGRGMGLYIVRQFLKSFGGDIELLPMRNEYGNRYIFEVRINQFIEDNE